VLNVAVAYVAVQMLTAGVASGEPWRIAMPAEVRIFAQTSGAANPRPPGWHVAGTEGSGARLRDGPSTQAGTMKTLAEGTVVDPVGGPVVNDGLSWTQVRTQTNDLGWVADMLLQPPPGFAPAEAPPPAAAASSSSSSLPAGGTYVIGETDGTGANLRQDPGTGAPVISLLADGTAVEPLDETITVEDRVWRKIRANGREGWVVAVVVRPK
jgi:SH3-like domain-containing protein